MAFAAIVLLTAFAALDAIAIPLAADNSTDSISLSSSAAAVLTTVTQGGMLLSSLRLGSGASDIVGPSTPSVVPTNVDQASSTSIMTIAPSNSTESPVQPEAATTSTTTITSTVSQPASTVTVTGPLMTITDTITVVQPPTPSSSISMPTSAVAEATTWSAPAQMTDLTAFSIKNFASGSHNLRIIVSDPPIESEGVPSQATLTPETLTEAVLAVVSAVSAGIIPPLPEDESSSFLQVYYPANSINPGQEPKGGADFYATPLDFSKAKNVSLEYSVFFPSNFDWVEAGKLPGIYGGHQGCSGGDSALSCFSTRLMWRAGGAGELYLYAPKDRQTAALCSTPPESVCDSQYGLSIGRGSFHFAAGNWTHVKQTVVLNTPGQQDGVFTLDVNGERVIDRSDVLYRDATSSNALFSRDTYTVPATDSSTEPPPPPPLFGMLGARAEYSVPAIDTSTEPPGTPDGLPSILPVRRDVCAAPFHMKVDSILTNAKAVRDSVPSFPRPESHIQARDDQKAFTPAFVPASGVSPDTGAVDIAPPVPNVVSVTSMLTVGAPVQTTTHSPTSTVTEYVVAIESGLSLPVIEMKAAEPVGFTGLFFSTFFGGHEPRYATPRDQFTWFKDFSMSINA